MDCFGLSLLLSFAMICLLGCCQASKVGRLNNHKVISWDVFFGLSDPMLCTSDDIKCEAQLPLSVLFMKLLCGLMGTRSLQHNSLTIDNNYIHCDC